MELMHQYIGIYNLNSIFRSVNSLWTSHYTSFDALLWDIDSVPLAAFFRDPAFLKILDMIFADYS
jgi:hypothetical protein